MDSQVQQTISEVLQCLQCFNRAEATIADTVEQTLAKVNQLKESPESFDSEDYKKVLTVYGALNTAKGLVDAGKERPAYVSVWAVTEIISNLDCKLRGIDPSEADTLTLDYSLLRQAAEGESQTQSAEGKY